jgi:hypothetical protein
VSERNKGVGLARPNQAAELTKRRPDYLVMFFANWRVMPLPSIELCRHGAERDGVAHSVYWRDAVLPHTTRLARQQVERARLCSERETLPFVAYLAAEPKFTG